MSIPALGVERIIGYPRALVEPLLWLALVTGGMWLMVAFDIRRGLAPGADVPGQLPTLAAALSLVLLINASAALVLQAQSGWASRGVAVAAGLGLGISAWGLTMVANLDPGLKHFLFWGSISTGGLLVALSLTRWRYHDTNAPRVLPGSFALSVVGLLGIGAMVLIWVSYRAFDLGLAANAPGEVTGWSSLVPALALLAGVFSAMAAVWRRYWWWAAGLLGVSVVIAEFALLAVN
ncbi:MAG: hypothetical protein KDB63_16110 [Nocardioidaceae bacterium]|nr:hypothetical protein [Nocardioidaceae bacterium]